MTATKERLWWMEPHLQAAVEYYGRPVTLVNSGEPSRFRIYLLPRFETRSARVLYEKATGRRECTRLELWDPQARRVVVSLDFVQDTDEYTRRRAAFRFMELVKRHLHSP
ncbi:MAG: hypothetical protein HY821_03870 [Acidobacteria bacterium]|nr:hypothetical protein [Acidobacteriota bacterium]